MSGLPRIDFYVLENQSPNGRFKLACKIIEKAYKTEHKIYLRTSNAEDTALLDDLLWTFSQSSFVPHQLIDNTVSITSPVLIGIELPKQEGVDVLISVADEPIVDFSLYPRIAEIVGFEVREREQGRNHFRYYREHGIEPKTYRIRL